MNQHSNTTSASMPELWAHQKNAILLAKKRFALFFDPGCGKSRTAIELYKRAMRTELCVDGQRKVRAIIFAPLNVCRNWENELAQYLDSPFRTFLVSGQTKPKKLKIMGEFCACNDLKSQFLICNIEALRSKEYVKALCESQASFIIVDESHNFKSHDSLQTRGLFSVVDSLRPSFLYLLTGTPAPQGEIDLWSTLRLLNQTNDSFFIWRKKYFDDKNERRRGYAGYWPDYKINNTGRETIPRQLSECSVSARKNAVLDLPPFLRTNIYSEMAPEQRRHYETMKEFLFAIDAEGNELNAANFLTRTLRLQQILAGFLGDVPIKKNPRIDALGAAIDKTADEPFIVWTIFKATYQQLSDELTSRGIAHGFLTGAQSAEERFEAMQSFQNGKLKALIAHPKAGGVGVNLTAASYSIHYTRSFSLTDDLQAEARNYRGGSERHKTITRIDIITPDTLDEEISTALREKKSVQDFILGLKGKHHERKAA